MMGEASITSAVPPSPTSTGNRPVLVQLSTAAAANRGGVERGDEATVVGGDRPPLADHPPLLRAVRGNDGLLATALGQDDGEVALGRPGRIEGDVDQVGMVVDGFVEGGPCLAADGQVGDGDEAPVLPGLHPSPLHLQSPETDVEVGARAGLDDELRLGRRRLRPAGGPDGGASTPNCQRSWFFLADAR